MKLELRGVTARHPQARPGAAAALQPLALDVASGEHVAVIGASGAGKTSLLQVLALAMQPSAGSLRIDGTAPWALPRRALQRFRGRLFLAPQVPPLPPRQRVVTAVLAGRLPAMGLLHSVRSLLHPHDAAAAQAALARFDLADKLFDRVDRLSGGERQRVGLARALLAPARLWLLDEPLSALDPARAAQALQALLQVARERGITLVASLHQVELALAHFPRAVGLREGRLLFDLPAADVTPQRLAQLYARPGGPAAQSQAAQSAARRPFGGVTAAGVPTAGALAAGADVPGADIAGAAASADRSVGAGQVGQVGQASHAGAATAAGVADRADPAIAAIAAIDAIDADDADDASTAAIAGDGALSDAFDGTVAADGPAVAARLRRDLHCR